MNAQEKALVDEFHRLCRLFALGQVELWEVQAIGKEIVKLRRGF